MNLPAAPTISQGVSDADIRAYGNRCYIAGKREQRRQTSTLTLEEVDARADVYRAEGAASVALLIAEAAIDAVIAEAGDIADESAYRERKLERLRAAIEDA